MSEAPLRRTYRSPRREQQARATRLAILQAAHRLFTRDGYVPTTMQAVGTEAGVAVKTVYLAFATKSALLRAVWDLVLKGDVDDAPVARRPWYREVLDEPDPARKLVLLAHHSCVVKRRIGPMLRVIRSAATVDDDSAALWSLIQSDFYDNQRAVVETLDRAGALRADLDITKATDILWTLNHPDTWLLLQGERGWSPETFETWFAATARQQLLADVAPETGGPLQRQRHATAVEREAGPGGRPPASPDGADATAGQQAGGSST